MEEHIIRVDNHKCIGCSICVKDCPTNDIYIDDKKAVFKAKHCIKCAHCVAICPHGAVSMSGFDAEPIKLTGKETVDPHELLKALQARRTIRQFKNKEIPKDIINQIIEAGRLTPTGGNKQGNSYIVLDSQKNITEAVAVKFMRKITPILKIFFPVAKAVDIDDNFFFKGAPIAILVLSKDKIDGSLASSNMALMAEAFGLGVLFSGYFTMASAMSPSLRKTIGLNRKNKVVATLVIGYPSVKYHRTAQKEPAKITWL